MNEPIMKALAESFSANAKLDASAGFVSRGNDFTFGMLVVAFPASMIAV